MMQLTRIIAVRHGETAWNVDARIQGSLDIPLNTKGQWQATRTGLALAGESIDAIYASDLWRAYATALEIGKHHQINPITHEGLRERVFGEFQGRTFEEVREHWPEKAERWRRRDLDFAPEGGESLLQFRERIVATARQLASNCIGQSVVWVAHGGVMDVLYREATGQDLSATRTWELGNAAINRLLWNGEHFTLVGWNDTGHLDDTSVLSDEAV
jgi:2,3-bisphosphoglycerate-dependent phosphoglycerate mutase